MNMPECLEDGLILGIFLLFTTTLSCGFHYYLPETNVLRYDCSFYRELVFGFDFSLVFTIYSFSYIQQN